MLKKKQEKSKNYKKNIKKPEKSGEKKLTKRLEKCFKSSILYMWGWESPAKKLTKLEEQK